MKKESTPKNEMTKYSIMVLVFVISIVLIGMSLSYAYFTASFKGNTDTGQNQTAIFNVTTNLQNASAISNVELAIIDPLDYKTKGEKISFTVSNENTSNVNGKYTIKLVEMSLSKNLFSKYFKWELCVNEGSANEKKYNGTFEDTSQALEGTEEKTEISNLTKQLITDENAILLNIGATDNITFYIWLENDDAVNQLYLTEGTFSGKLSIDAVPTKEGL